MTKVKVYVVAKQQHGERRRILYLSLLAFLFLSSVPALAEWRPISHAEGRRGLYDLR